MHTKWVARLIAEQRPVLVPKYYSVFNLTPLNLDRTLPLQALYQAGNAVGSTCTTITRRQGAFESQLSVDYFFEYVNC